MKSLDKKRLRERLRQNCIKIYDLVTSSQELHAIPLQRSIPELNWNQVSSDCSRLSSSHKAQVAGLEAPGMLAGHELELPWLKKHAIHTHTRSIYNRNHKRPNVRSPLMIYNYKCGHGYDTKEVARGRYIYHKKHTFAN